MDSIFQIAHLCIFFSLFYIILIFVTTSWQFSKVIHNLYAKYTKFHGSTKNHYYVLSLNRTELKISFKLITNIMDSILQIAHL